VSSSSNILVPRNHTTQDPEDHNPYLQTLFLLHIKPANLSKSLSGSIRQQECKHIGLWASLSWLHQLLKICLKQHVYQMHTTYSTTNQEPVQISFPSISHN